MEGKLELTDPEHSNAVEAAEATARLLVSINERRCEAARANEEQSMPPRKLFGVADLNIPGRDTKAIAAHVKTASAGGKPITTEQIAKALNCSAGGAEYGLNMAKRMGLVRQMAKGWVAG